MVWPFPDGELESLRLFDLLPLVELDLPPTVGHMHQLGNFEHLSGPPPSPAGIILLSSAIPKYF